MGAGDVALKWTVRLATAVVIAVVGLWVIRKVAPLVEAALTRSKAVRPAIATWLSSVMAFVLKYFLMTIILGVLGLDTGLFVVLTAAFVLALALSADESMQNMAAGLMLLSFEYYKVGDIVEIGGELGTVARIELYSTRLLLPDGRICIVTNSNALNGNIANVTCGGDRALRLNIPVGIAYTDSVHEARRLALEVLANDPVVLDDPRPEVVVVELGDNSVNLLARPWIKPALVGRDGHPRRHVPPSKTAMDVLVHPAVMWTVGHRLMEQIKLRFDEGGITIPFPQRDWHLNLVPGLRSPFTYPNWKGFGGPAGADAFFRRDATNPGSAGTRQREAEARAAAKSAKPSLRGLGRGAGRAFSGAGRAFSGAARSAKTMFKAGSRRRQGDAPPSPAEPSTTTSSASSSSMSSSAPSAPAEGRQAS